MQLTAEMRRADSEYERGLISARGMSTETSNNFFLKKIIIKKSNSSAFQSSLNVMSSSSSGSSSSSTVFSSNMATISVPFQLLPQVYVFIGKSMGTN